MLVRTSLAAGAVLATGLVLTGTATAAPTPFCESYSGTCVTSPPEEGISPSEEAVAPSDEGTAGTEASTSSLPLTGGEVVLISLLGAAALAGGTALVVAGRRSSSRDAAA